MKDIKEFELGELPYIVEIKDLLERIKRIDKLADKVLAKSFLLGKELEEIKDVEKIHEWLGSTKRLLESFVERKERIPKDLLDKLRLKLDKMENIVIDEYGRMVSLGRKLGQKELIEGKYSLFTDEWIVEPHTIDLDFNPDEFYEERRKVIEEFVKEFDLKIADIKRVIQDIDFLKETIENVPDIVKRKWRKWIDEKINKLEEEINQFYEKIDEVIEARHELKERYGPDVEENLLFKYLQRYQYIWLAKELKRIMGKGFEEVEEVEKVKEVVREFPFKKKSQLEDVDIPEVPPMEMPLESPEMGLRRELGIPGERPPMPPKPEKSPVAEEFEELIVPPKIWKRLEPIDRMRFYVLEKQRKDAISRGDMAELKRIHEEEERIIEKYKKELMKADELTGFAFATRLLEAHYKIQRNKNPIAEKIFDKISEELMKIGAVINTASVLSVESDEWGIDVNNGEAEFVLDISFPEYLLSKRSIIVKGVLHNGEVIVHPYFYDFLGRKYSLDSAVLREYVKGMREKLSDEWLEGMFKSDKEMENVKKDKLFELF